MKEERHPGPNSGEFGYSGLKMKNPEISARSSKLTNPASWLWTMEWNKRCHLHREARSLMAKKAKKAPNPTPAQDVRPSRVDNAHAAPRRSNRSGGSQVPSKTQISQVSKASQGASTGASKGALKSASNGANEAGGFGVVPDNADDSSSVAHNRVSPPPAVPHLATTIATIHVDFATPEEALLEHAEQLGLQLSEQQRRVDRREATLTSRESELESELRNARLELQHQQETLANYEEQLVERDAELKRRLTEIATLQLSGEYDLATQVKEASQRDRQLLRREGEIQETERRLDRLARQVARREAKHELEKQRTQRDIDKQRQQQAGQVETDRRQHLRLLRQWERRRRKEGYVSHVDQQQLLDRLAELDDRAQDIETRLQLGLDEIERKWAALRKATGDVEAKRLEHEKRLENRHSSLIAMKESVAREQRENRETLREALDLRMAAELLFRQVAKKNGTAETVSQWGELRARLTRLREEEQAHQKQQRQEMAELARRLSQRQREMREYRDQLLRWRRDTLAAIQT